jgi:hypothetical protein
MRNFWEELNNPIEIIRENKESKTKELRIYNKKKSLTPRENLIKIVETSYNKQWSDGRIYGLSKNGEYTSHSVSPYSKNFLKNIEKNIKPLVVALMEKNYFSISSCEGHGIYFKRYVTIIFPSKETALEFQLKLPFKKLKFNLSHSSDVLNNSLEVDEYGNILNSKKENRENSKEASVDYVNCFIKRNYADAWFLEIIISDQIKHEEGFLKYFKNWKEIFFKKIFMNYYTKKITNFVKKELDKNIY